MYAYICHGTRIDIRWQLAEVVSHFTLWESQRIKLSSSDLPIDTILTDTNFKFINIISYIWHKILKLTHEALCLSFKQHCFRGKAVFFKVCPWSTSVRVRWVITVTNECHRLQTNLSETHPEGWHLRLSILTCSCKNCSTKLPINMPLVGFHFLSAYHRETETKVQKNNIANTKQAFSL